MRAGGTADISTGLSIPYVVSKISLAFSFISDVAIFPMCIRDALCESRRPGQYRALRGVYRV